MTPKLRNCHVKICWRQWGIFVIVCGICQGVDKKQISKWQNWPKKPRKYCTKIKPEIVPAGKRSRFILWAFYTAGKILDCLYFMRALRCVCNTQYRENKILTVIWVWNEVFRQSFKKVFNKKVCFLLFKGINFDFDSSPDSFTFLIKFFFRHFCTNYTNDCRCYTLWITHYVHFKRANLKVTEYLQVTAAIILILHLGVVVWGIVLGHPRVRKLNLSERHLLKAAK